MRTVLTVKPSVEAANRAIVDGTLRQIIDETIESLHPEASYFLTENGRRTAVFIFDLGATSDIPKIAEPFFTKLNAEVTFTPVMNYDELKLGLQLWRESATR